MKNNEFVEGVNIIAKYIPEDEKEKYGVHAEHDIVYFGVYEWVTDKEDVKRLEDLGWFENEEAWSCYT